MQRLVGWLGRIERLAPSKRAPLVLRLALGFVFLAHAYAKVAVYTLPGTVAFFEAHGLPGWTVYPVWLVELVGGVCLLLGVGVRVVGGALFVVMLGALVPHVPNGWMFTNPGGGWEYVAFLLCALATQCLLGAGQGRSGGGSDASPP